MSAQNNLNEQQFTKQQLHNWEPGQKACFEYHCLESPESGDAHLWYRSHQDVEVVGKNPGDPPGVEDLSPEVRAEEGIPLTYKVKFDDAYEDDVWEDELLSSPQEFYRPDPPKAPSDEDLFRR